MENNKLPANFIVYFITKFSILQQVTDFMKRLLIICFFIFNSSLLFSQMYGNEWMDYSKPYYKIPVTKEGIYRINKTVLMTAGFNFNQVMPASIQIFYKGQEQYIYFSGANPFIFNNNDYIEFYAKGNDGWFDAGLYDNPNDLTNPFYSMYTDTAYYFLTYNTSLNNLRVSNENIPSNYSAYLSSLASSCQVDVIYHNPVQFYNIVPGPRFQDGDGWYSSYFDVGSNDNRTIATPGFVAGTDSTVISLSVAGCSDASTTSSYNHHLQITYPNSSWDEFFKGYKVFKKTFKTMSALSPSTTIGIKSINDLGVVTDKMALIYLTLTYNRNFTFQGLHKQAFRIKDGNTNGVSLLHIEGFGSNNALIWDLTNHRRIPVVNESGVMKAIVPNNGNVKTCFITSIDSIYNVTSIIKKNYTDYSISGGNSDYIIITHPSLISSANAYKSYRNDNYNAFCYDIEQLYDQFAYGIKKHPLAIRNFLKYISTAYSTKPEYVLILGKGIHSGGNINESFRKNSTNFTNTLIPSFGVPSSDNLLVTKVLSSGNGVTPDIPIGRIAATNNQEVYDYLNKVIYHESLGPSEWMKRVMHFGGGNNTYEQTLFRNYLSADSIIISDTLYGAYVQTFLKTTSLPIQISVSDSVKNLIDQGVSIMNFFGHGSSTGFDQNIENPTFYNNTGKYPLLIANSCLAGDIYLPSKNISENWVLTPSLGSIAFLASVDLGYASWLHLFTYELYKQLTYKNYMKPIGYSIIKTDKVLYNNYGSNESMINTCLDFTLHGDPAVSLKCFDKPDLAIDNSSISFVPEILTSDIDPFQIKIIVTNIGMATNEPYMVKVDRTFPDGSSEIYTKTFTGSYYKDTLYMDIPTDFVRGPGVNSFCVTIDSENWIDEKNETNNNACTNVTIQTNDLIPVFPYEFAIYPNSNVTLKASTGYPFLGTNSYQFQIDTTDLFVQPLSSGTVTQSGGIVSWTPNLPPFTDSTVYFWRVCAVPQPGDTAKWKESSFTYIPGKTGWSQGHFFQLKKDGFENIQYNRNNRLLDFVSSPKGLKCRTIGNAWGNVEWYATGFYLDAIHDYSSCGAAPALLVVVIDPLTMQPWESSYFNSFGQFNYPSQPYGSSCPGRGVTDKYFIFRTDTASLENLANMLTNPSIIPDSFYVLVYTFMHGNFSYWPSATRSAFMSLGASQFLTYAAQNHNNYPYIFFGKKGDVTSVEELIADSARATLYLEKSLPTNYIAGNVKSTLIGPSSNWQTLHWKHLSREAIITDQVNLTLKGFANNNDSTILIPNLHSDSLHILDLGNYADASQYPYLRMLFNTQDGTNKTPNQLKLWQITYDEAPETAINPVKGQYFYNDTLQEGETVTFSVATENIGVYNMDSLLVRYWIQDKNNNLLPLAYKKLRSHPSGDVLQDTISFSTSGLPGLNHIWYEVNTTDTTTGNYDQLEQYHFNNFAEKAFFVTTDITNPLLDVTFDGIHIMNGDIVSAKPYILTTLKDENKFLALNNSSLFGVYLKDLSTGIETKISFDSSMTELQFTPAQLPHNSCKIEYRPTLSDGKYQLRIQAKDVSNNESGNIDYKINFEVINKSSITHIFNYPNPFSTATRFVFTLTGSEIPDDLRIQIMTISGKFVREIHLEELGPIHIGNNITQFTWDGTDTYGDKLANGVYFFRVFAKLNNETIEHRATEADGFFKNGFGKMYILR